MKRQMVLYPDFTLEFPGSYLKYFFCLVKYVEINFNPEGEKPHTPQSCKTLKLKTI